MTVRPAGKPVIKANLAPTLAVFILSLALLSLVAIVPSVYRATPQTVATPVTSSISSSSNVSLYGALTATSSAEVSCNAEQTVFALASNAQYSAQMVLTTGNRLGVGNSAYVLDSPLAKLAVNLVDTNGNVYRSFTATGGSLELSNTGGRLSGILVDASGEQVLASARWTCGN